MNKRPMHQASRPLTSASLPIYLLEAIRVYFEIHHGRVHDQTEILTALAAVAGNQILQHPDPIARRQMMDAFTSGVRMATNAEQDRRQAEQPFTSRN